MPKKAKIMDDPNAAIIHIKLDRRKCIACREKAYGRQLTDMEWSICFSPGGWWPLRDVRAGDGMIGQSSCPAPVVEKYIKYITKAPRTFAEKHVPCARHLYVPEVKLGVRNKIYCHEDPPIWCPYANEHAEWAAQTNRTFVLNKEKYFGRPHKGKI